ncbi:MAG: FliH/SctL family protein [Desulfosporosinus sp.]|nr:FliH/SctL family protein [Desulfosporosinus sp.]
MRLSINGRVVKSYDVEVLTPRILEVECKDCFQSLDTYLSVMTAQEDIPPISDSFSEVSPSALELEAKEKAALILAAAEANAQEIRGQAQADSEQLRQEVIRTAQAEIYPAAEAKGYQAGLEVGEAEGKRLTHTANQLFQLAQRAVQEEYAKVDEALLTLAIKIAERLVRSSLAVDPQRLAAIIQALSLLPQDREGWRLHVASEDALWLKETQAPCPLIVDESLSPGDCFLECQEGIFDARLESQLDKVEHILREELEHGGVELIDPAGGTD